MTITEYDVINCPFCRETIMAKLMVNCSLPLGEKIHLVDIHSGDPRLKFLKPTRMKDGGNVLPMILDVKREKGKFGDKYKGRYVIYSVLDSFHMASFIKKMKNII